MLTHGHEDHIGSLPYLLREFDRCPCTPRSSPSALLEGKLEEHGVRDRAEFHEVTPGRGGRGRAVHDALPPGVAFDPGRLRRRHRPPVRATLLHTGDFKLDPTPIDGRVTDLQGIAAEARRGVHLFLSDSTNAEDPGFAGSERASGRCCSTSSATRRELVVVACFASHIHRIQQVVNAARRGRAGRGVPRP